ncbi:AlbA family DNA-binding domain-containing protein [Nitrolancea hollandica]|nr:ATP-binding protein [Nitrolancea hollandica]
MLMLPAEDWSAVARRIRRSGASVAWSWVAISSASSGWELAVLSVRGCTTVQKAFHRYPDVIIATEQLTPTVASKRFLEGWTGAVPGLKEGLPFPPMKGKSHPFWVTSERDHEHYLVPPDWPQYYFHHSFGSTSDLATRILDPLHAEKLPFYPNLVAALAEIVYGIPPTRVPTSFSPHVLVRLPDRRCRIGAVTFNDGTVQIAIEEGRPAGSLGCCLRVVWRRESTDTEWIKSDLRIEEPGILSLETAGMPAELWALLVDLKGKVLDRSGWSASSGMRPQVAGSLTARVERWLTEGEHGQLEYKQKLGEDKAKRSFAETVAAFANGAGGIILVGVDDDSTVVGYDVPKAQDQIVDLIRNRVVESVAVEVDRVEVEEKPVYVVTVSPGDPDAKPYRCGGRVMIRALGTTREATTREIRMLSTEAVPRSGIFQ